MARNLAQLYTTLDQFDDLHAKVDEGRTKLVQVERQALLNILMDHSMLCGKVEDLGGVIRNVDPEKEPKEKG